MSYKVTEDATPVAKQRSETRATRSDRPTELEYEALLPEEGGSPTRYRPVSVLGVGGMGEVFSCIDRKCEREIAIKRIDPSMRDEYRRRRFLREARIQAQLDHPTVVPVYDIGVDPSGREYFTMKRALGRTLEDVLQGLREDGASVGGGYSLPVRLGIFRQMCQGVEYAHSRGIVHRDLKPANVMVGELGETYLLDWGIAKVLDATQGHEHPAVGEPSGALGTPGYMAPEQIRDAERVGPQADLYSLGAILFELLTLQPLHSGEDIESLVSSTLAGHSRQALTQALRLHGAAPELIRACVMATPTEPSERLGNVSLLLDMISAYLDGDRDWRMREEMASRHAQSALHALRCVLEADDPKGEKRGEALREAGHALALDPKCTDAVRVITELFANPPTSIPEDAQVLLRRQRAERGKIAASSGLLAYLAMIPLAGSLLLIVEIRNWYAVAAMLLPLFAAIAFNRYYILRKGTKAPALLVTGAVLCSISATSAIAGPFLIMPGLLAGYAAVSMAGTDELTERPWPWAALCFAAAVVPVALQVLGVLPAGVHFLENGQLLIEHQISDASPTTRLVGLIGATFLAVFGPMYFAYRYARAMSKARQQLVVHMWHLRQLTSGDSAVARTVPGSENGPDGDGGNYVS